jgi:hypothetical protein
MVSSPHLNVGTTAITPALLAELPTQTTYAPQSGSSPDTNAPDLGYHYPVTEDSAPVSLARVGQGIEDEVKRRDDY